MALKSYPNKFRNTNGYMTSKRDLILFFYSNYSFFFLDLCAFYFWSFRASFLYSDMTKACLLCSVGVYEYRSLSRCRYHIKSVSIGLNINNIF